MPREKENFLGRGSSLCQGTAQKPCTFHARNAIISGWTEPKLKDENGVVIKGGIVRVLEAMDWSIQWLRVRVLKLGFVMLCIASLSEHNFCFLHLQAL